MKVSYTIVFSGSSIRHTSVLTLMDVSKSYPFTKSVEKVMSHIKHKYGWSTEEIVSLEVKLDI